MISMGVISWPPLTYWHNYVRPVVANTAIAMVKKYFVKEQ